MITTLPALCHCYLFIDVCCRSSEVLTAFSYVHQEKVLCLAVLQGQLRLYYDFNGTLIEHPPDSNDLNLLKISDGELRLVSLTCFYLCFILSFGYEAAVGNPLTSHHLAPI